MLRRALVSRRRHIRIRVDYHRFGIEIDHDFLHPCRHFILHTHSLTFPVVPNLTALPVVVRAVSLVAAWCKLDNAATNHRGL
jgi:hypothetical protein